MGTDRGGAADHPGLHGLIRVHGARPQDLLRRALGLHRRALLHQGPVGLGRCCTRSRRTSSSRKGYLALLIGVLGTTISPYLFFWQSMHRIEDMREEPAGGDEAAGAHATSRDWRRPRNSPRVASTCSRGWESRTLVMFAIIVATAVTLDRHGHHVIDRLAGAGGRRR